MVWEVAYKKNSNKSRGVYLIIEDIRLINFRNYNDIYLKLNNKINLFIGNNAQGKTNLLESIYIASMGNSFRTNRDRELINFDKKESYIGLNYNINNMNKLIEIKLSQSEKKRIKLNRLELDSLKMLKDELNIVLFLPDDLYLVKGSPNERRNLLNNSISNLKPLYKYNLIRYNKILFQRNNLLKSKKTKNDIKKLIEIFDMQLSDIGSDIILYRKSYLDKLEKITNSVHGNLTFNKEKIDFIYKNNIDINVYKKENIKELFLRKLEETFEKDRIVGTTEIGPHKDDFDILINEINAKKYASQGQQRTVVLSMKLSEIEIIYYERGEYPILLLDDVFSELDKNRREYLTNFLRKTQTIITSTDLIEIEELSNISMSVFNIENGNIRKN